MLGVIVMTKRAVGAELDTPLNLLELILMLFFIGFELVSHISSESRQLVSKIISILTGGRSRVVRLLTAVPRWRPDRIKRNYRCSAPRLLATRRRSMMSAGTRPSPTPRWRAASGRRAAPRWRAAP